VKASCGGAVVSLPPHVCNDWPTIALADSSQQTSLDGRQRQFTSSSSSSRSHQKLYAAVLLDRRAQTTAGITALYQTASRGTIKLTVVF